MTRDPLVSLIMPVWQPRPDWLRAAVRSALGQRGCRLELIVVDDGNPEPISGLLAELDKRLRVMRIPRSGVSQARNTGLAAARGEYVRFVDADDVLEAGSTARLLELLRQDVDVISYGSIVFCDEQLRPVWTMRSTLAGDARIPSLLGLFRVRPWAMLFPRQVVEATGEWDASMTVSQDWDYVQRALEHAYVRGEDAVATYYRKHAGASTTRTAIGIAASRTIVERYFERHPEQRGTALERHAYARLDAMAARICLTHRRPREASRRLAQALVRDPRSVAQEVRLGAPALAGSLRRLVFKRAPVGDDLSGRSHSMPAPV